VVYVTATFPYVMLIILLIRGVTLPGAAQGIEFYLYPDLSRLSDPQVVGPDPKRVAQRKGNNSVLRRRSKDGCQQQLCEVHIAKSDEPEQPILEIQGLRPETILLHILHIECFFLCSQVWVDAGTQIFFSYAICLGCLTALGSYNNYNNNCYRAEKYVCTGKLCRGDCVDDERMCHPHETRRRTGIVRRLEALDQDQRRPSDRTAPQGLYHALLFEQRHQLCGRFCYIFCAWFYGLRTRGSNCRSCRIRSVDLASFSAHTLLPCCIGPGLAFIAYPKAVTMMPLAPLWAALFFMMLIFLGLDSQFVCVESLVTAVVDMYPKIFRRGYRRELLILALSIASYFIGLIMLTEGGMYVFQLFDSYAASGMCLLFVAVFECICIGWIYGSNRFYDNIEDMIGHRPFFLIKWCWMVFTPGICASIFIFFLVKYKPLKYNNVYTYPTWGYGIGWMMALSSMVCIPLWIIVKVWKTEGTISERFKSLILPSPDLKMRGNLRAAACTNAVNDCDAQLKGDGTISAITEKETHF
ncbi:unnamed protein product, partial [Ranitomeya imitator]